MVTGRGQKTNSVLVFPPLTRTLWIDGLTKKWKRRLEITNFQ